MRNTKHIILSDDLIKYLFQAFQRNLKNEPNY